MPQTQTKHTTYNIHHHQPIIKKRRVKKRKRYDIKSNETKHVNLPENCDAILPITNTKHSCQQEYGGRTK
jgi:hypothetical protein